MTPAHSCPKISPSLSSNACTISVWISSTHLAVIQVQVGTADGRTSDADQGVFGVREVGYRMVFDAHVVFAVPLYVSP
jgi:hypothetical protein